MSSFQCTTCWKTFKLRIQLAMHLKHRHNEGGFEKNSTELSENESDRAQTNDRDEGEKAKPTENMAACRAASAFMCAFECNEQFTDLQMWFAHCLEAHKLQISQQPRKYFPDNHSREFSSQQTIKTTMKEIPVYDISSSEDESALPAKTNCERRVEVEEEAPVTTCESLGNSNNSTVTNLVRQHQPETTFPSQSNYLRMFIPCTKEEKKDEVLTSNRLRQGVMLHKRRPRRCPYCSQKFSLSVDTYRHIKAVHGKLLTRNDGIDNCNESKNCLIDTSGIAVVSSQSSYPLKSYKDDIIPDVSSDATYSIQGYKCKLCLKTFRRLAVFKSHFRVRQEFIPFIPSFVLKHQQSEQLSWLSRSPNKGNVFLEAEKEQKSVDLIDHSSTANKSSDSQEVESNTNRGESSVLLESEANKTRTNRKSKSVEILNDPPVPREAMNRKEKLKHRCPSCPKLFGSRRLRDDHLTIHSGEKRYKCPLCDHRMRFHQYFKYHMKKFHGHPNYNVEEAVDGNVEVASTQESQEVINFLVTYNATTKSVHVALPKQV